MTHEVILTRFAQNELDQAHDWWTKNRSAAQANRWYSSFVRTMLTLETNPERVPLAPESALFPYDVRQLNFGLSGKPTHRALFSIRDKTVVILRVRHLSQKPLSADDF